MNPKIRKYPLDLKGDLRGNRVFEEIHNLDRQEIHDYRVIVMDNGYFFKDSVIVKEQVTQRELKVNEDYQLTGFSPEFLELSGKVACSAIVIHNPKVLNDLVVTAQMVGGVFSDVGPAIANRLKGLGNRTRKIRFADIKDVPDTVTLNGHIHPYWDLYTFTPRTALIARMVTPLRINLIAELDKMMEDYDREFAEFIEDKSETYRKFMDHIMNHNNPHKTTLEMLKLEDVVDGPIGTLADMNALNTSYPNKYLTPYLLNAFKEKHIAGVLSDHIARKDNPHKETADQIGVYSESNFTSKSGMYYDRGETTSSTIRFGGNKNDKNETTSTGKTFDVLYSELRANLNANEIKSGTLSPINIGGSRPSVQSFLTYDNGRLQWKRGSDLTSLFGVVENRLVSARWADADKTDHVRPRPMNTAEAVQILNSQHPPYYQPDGTIGNVYYYGREYLYIPFDWTDNPNNWRWLIRHELWRKHNPNVQIEVKWPPPASAGTSGNFAKRADVPSKVPPTLPDIAVGQTYIIMSDSANRNQWTVIRVEALTPDTSEGSVTPDTSVGSAITWTEVNKAMPIFGAAGPPAGPDKPTHNIAMYISAGIALASVSGSSWLI